MPNRVIAVDCSTTSTKALVVDADGTVLAQGHAPVTTDQPWPDHYEQDPEQWVRTTDQAIAQAVSQLTDADRGAIGAVCLTAQRQTFTLTNADAVPLRPGIVWLDARAAEQVARLGSAHVHELSGFPPDVTPSFYKLAWLADHEPELLRDAAHVASVTGLLTRRFTGRWADGVATADSLGLHDQAALRFSSELADAAGLRPDQLPELVNPGEAIADITCATAERWGLRRPVPLVAACGDGQAAALGCGATGPDEAYLNMGTALVAGVHCATYRTGSVYRTDAAGLRGQWVLEIVQNSGAHLAGWFRERLGDPALLGNPDPGLDAAAACVPIGSDGLLTLPYWNAVQSPHWDPLARGAIVGLSGTHGRPEIYRSLLEGISLEMARNLRGLESDTGMPLRTVCVMGGGQRSDFWRQMIADAANLPLVTCDTDEVSALGAAVIGVAHLTGEDAATVSRRLARRGGVTEPDPDAAKAYEQLSGRQALLYPALRQVFASP